MSPNAYSFTNSALTVTPYAGMVKVYDDAEPGSETEVAPSPVLATFTVPGFR